MLCDERHKVRKSFLADPVIDRAGNGQDACGKQDCTECGQE